VYSQLRELVLDSKVRPGKEDTYIPILEVYKSSLEERAEVQAKSLKVINTYLNSVNRFLDDKQLILRKESPSALPTLLVKFDDTNPYSKIQALSSGERQIVTLLYSVTHMSGQRVVLIDEPEISLHIDWQNLLIPEMVAQLQDLQIIACTHSPMIGGEKYEDQLIELEIKPTSRNGANYSEDIVEDIEEEL
jgi:predicted ATP-binding protein involved in virulence